VRINVQLKHGPLHENVEVLGDPGEYAGHPAYHVQFVEAGAIVDTFVGRAFGDVVTIVAHTFESEDDRCGCGGIEVYYDDAVDSGYGCDVEGGPWDDIVRRTYGPSAGRRVRAYAEDAGLEDMRVARMELAQAIEDEEAGR
jgi:hypothetical protein